MPPSDLPPSQRSAASAARHATDDPNLFLIPEEHLPPGFAEKVESGGWTPAPPRPAATVVLLREAPGGPEALLLRRHRRSGFAADAWVFPGGTVDPADRDPEILDRLDGPAPGEWAARLRVADAGEALGYVVAALREAFEETGILLARWDHVGNVHADMAGSLEVARRALLDGVVGLREVAVGNGVRLAGDDLLYIAHWITPEPEPRRYDTRFFLARVDPGAECIPHEAEMTDARWMRPGEAVERFRAGEMKLLPPTVHTLRRLAGHGSLAEAWEALRDAPVPATLPRMRRHPQGVAIEVPGGESKSGSA
ncbi:MAG TPA: NUDIX domain-containing protein [Longimicrobiaceae bacterium]|nr:NUDIX domain-containing protein [Longimicrobiaceae bacterium]